MTRKAICASCGEEIEANTEEQEAEARKQFEDIYGVGTVEENDCVVVCDPCFQKFYSCTRGYVLEGGL